MIEIVEILQTKDYTFKRIQMLSAISSAVVAITPAAKVAVRLVAYGACFGVGIWMARVFTGYIDRRLEEYDLHILEKKHAKRFSNDFHDGDNDEADHHQTVPSRG